VSKRTRIKICGVRDVASAQAAVEAGADAIGLVFVDRSPRSVSIDEAHRIVRSLPAFVDPVGLFSDAPWQEVRDAAAAVGIDTVQLHGREGPGFLSRLRHLRVIKAVPFEPGRLAEQLDPWRRGVSNLASVLIDAPPKSVAHGELTGGSGVPFDWEALEQEIAQGVLRDLPPMTLAGGLRQQNVGQAIRLLRPYAVDVSSGVESSRGTKDAEMIHAFCQAVSRTDYELLHASAV